MKKINMCASNRAVFENMGCTPEEFSQLMFDTANGGLVDVSARDANEKIRDVMYASLGVERGCSRKELRRAMRRNKVAFFEIWEDTVDQLMIGGWNENPFFQQYVDYRSADYGDANVWITEDTTILTVSEVSGGHHDIIRQRLGAGAPISIKTQWYAAKVYTEFELFLAGRIDWAKLIQKIYEAFDYKVMSLVYTAFNGAGSVIPNSSQFVKSGALVKSNLLTLVEDVQGANVNKEVVIMGTKSGLAALTALADTDWISDGMKDVRNTLGHLGIWEGVRLVEIPQVFAPNDTTTKLVSNKKLLVMPVDPANKMIKVYDEGDGMIKEISDGTTNMDMTLEYEYQRKMGIGVVFSRYFGTWTMP